MQVTSATTSAVSPTSTASTSAGSSSALSETQFLQLLTEQLENQDPLQPEDDTQFLAQMAQFTSLQETNTLNQQVERLTASSYIGSSVTVNPGGASVTGQVTGVDTSGADPQLVINGSEYPLAELQMVAPTSASSSASSSSSASGASAQASSTTPAATVAAAARAAAVKAISIAASPKT